MSHLDLLDRFRELVPSWPWSDFPKPPDCVLELVEAVVCLRDLIAEFSETGNQDILNHARTNQKLIADANSRLGKFGFYKDRKRTIRKTRKQLQPTIDLLNAQMTLLNAAYPPQPTFAERMKVAAIDFSAAQRHHFYITTRDLIIKTDAGTSY